MKLFEIFGTVKVDTKDAERNLKSFEASSKKTGRAIENISSKATKLGSSISDFGSKISDVGGKMTKNFTAPITAAITGSIALTHEYREEMAKLDTAFEQNGKSVEEGRKAYSALYQTLGEEDTSVEAAQQLAGLTDSQKELTEWTNVLTGVYATFGDALPIEGLAEAANETAKTAELAGPLADALNWAGVNEEEFKLKLEETNDERDRANLILDTMNGLYKDAGEAYKENNEGIMKQREAQERLTAAIADFAVVALPIVTELTDMLAGLLEKFGNLSEDQQELIIKAGLFVAALGPVISVIGTIVSGVGGAITIFGKLAGSWGTIASVGSTLASVLAATVGAIFSPVGLIIAGIAAVIAAGVALWKNWDKVKEFGGKLKDGLVNSWNKLTESTKEAFGNIKDFGSDMVKGLKSRWDSLGSETKETFKTMARNMLSPITGLYDSIKKIVERIKKAFKFEIKFPKIKAPKWLAKVIPSLDDDYDGPEANPAGSTGRAGGSRVGKRFFAKGGYMGNATEFARVNGVSHIAGEAGGEGIVPLEGRHMVPFANHVAKVLRDNAGSGAQVNNEFNIASLVVREEADIRRIAEELEALTVRKNRLRGAY